MEIVGIDDIGQRDPAANALYRWFGEDGRNARQIVDELGAGQEEFTFQIRKL